MPVEYFEEFRGCLLSTWASAFSSQEERTAGAFQRTTPEGRAEDPKYGGWLEKERGK